MRSSCEVEKDLNHFRGRNHLLQQLFDPLLLIHLRFSRLGREPRSQRVSVVWETTSRSRRVDDVPHLPRGLNAREDV